MIALVGRAGIVLATAGLAATLVPGAAHAEKYTHHDSWRDVTAMTIVDENDDDLVEVPAPTVRDGDITTTTIDHRRRSVVIRTKYAELTRQMLRGNYAWLSTSKKAGFVVTLLVESSRNWQGRAALYPDRGRTLAGCRRLPHRIDYTANTITVRVPTRCIRNPKWVRVGAQSYRINEDEDVALYVDDAFSKTYDMDARQLAMSPRVWRG